jgi:putative FmdB family regulatory protein
LFRNKKSRNHCIFIGFFKIMRRSFNSARLRQRIMPIYEYRCDNCGHELEAFRKISEEPLLACPQCSQDALVKKVSAAGFRLKGSGWYETDFKSGKKKNVSSSDAERSESSSKSDKSTSSESSSAASSSSSGDSSSGGSSSASGSS